MFSPKKLVFKGGEVIFKQPLDVGEKYDPKIKCYDHHQTPMEECKLSLLLKEWDLWKKATEVYDWLEISVLLDAEGPKEVRQRLGINSKVMASLDSFPERALLKFFEQEDRITRKHILFSLMKEFGRYFFESIRNYFHIRNEIEEKVIFKRIKNVLVTISPLNINHSSHIVQILKEKRKEKYPNEKGGIFIYPNKRVQGTIALKRYRDDKRVDFRRLKGLGEVICIHPKGFFASVESMPPEELEGYLKKAIK